MSDLDPHDQDNIEYLSRRLRALDRNIPVPETVKAQALMRRAQQTPPPKRADSERILKWVAGVAAALILVVAGAFDQSQVAQIPSYEAAQVGVPEIAMLMDAPEASMAAPRGAPATNAMDSFFAQDYSEIREQLKLAQGEPQKMYPDTGGSAQANPDAGPSFSEDLGAVGEVYTTNVQTEQVDEADIVKTDGEYLYYLCSPPNESDQTSEAVVKILSSATLAVAATIEFAEEVYPTELFLAGDKLAVLTRSNIGTIPVYRQDSTGEKEAGTQKVASTALAIYDISNPEKPVSENKFEQQGRYTSSRLVEDVVYLVTNCIVPNANISKVTDEQLIPSVLNTAVSVTPSLLAAADICLPATIVNGTYTVVSAISLSQPADSDTKAVLGAGDTVYMSRNNLYVAGTKYDETGTDATHYTTTLLKFAADNTALTLMAQGTVPGQIEGQFALNESASGNLSIATTVQQYIDPAAAQAAIEARKARIAEKEAGILLEPLSKEALAQEKEARRTTTHSGVYVLDGFLQRLGQIEGLAPEENLYAVRYIGDIAYLVTFKQVDPLFAVDLSDPTAPKVLGQLKVPGFSEYLHPIGSNTLLGLGYETQAFDDGTSMTMGIKLSLFDVSNPSAPTEKQTYSMGDRGSYSQALYNHKAFLYYKQQDLVVLPVTLYTADDAKTADPWANNYKFAFDGLYLFKVTPEKVEYYGTVSHNNGLDDSLLQQKGLAAKRSVFVNDAIYLFSDAMVTSYSLATLEQTAQVRLDPAV